VENTLQLRKKAFITVNHWNNSYPADSAESTPPIFSDKSQINLRSSAIQSTQISRKYFLIQMTQRIHRRFTQIRKKKSAFICGPISTNQREMFSPVN